MNLKIGQTVWEVTETPHIEPFGVTEYMGGEILLNSNQSASQMVDSLLHEALHALVWSYGIQLGTQEEEEAVIKTLTPALLSLLYDNPEFVFKLLKSH